MSKSKEVILIKPVRGLGKLGDRKTVKMGYANNYLIPQNLALPVTQDTLVRFESIRKKEEKRLAKEKESAEAVAKVIEGQAFSFEVSTHDDGKLYGSVGAGEIAAAIQEKLEVKLEKKQFPYLDPIKEVGDTDVVIDCGLGVEATVKVTVTSASSEEDAE